jgi:hypothetical protein
VGFARPAFPASTGSRGDESPYEQCSRTNRMTCPKWMENEPIETP